MAGLVWNDEEATVSSLNVCKRVFWVHELHVCVSHPETESCNWMATFAFALTGVSCWLLVLSDQRVTHRSSQILPMDYKW